MEQDPLIMAAHSFNRVEIDINALQANFQAVQGAAAGQARIMAVVKSDAYGHGLVECAEAIYRAGGRTFGVAEAWEGVVLRQAGLQGEIVILLGCGPETDGEIISHRLTPVVYDVDCINRLSQEAARRGADVKVHLKVDVGMGRLGVLPAEVESYAALIKRLPNITLAGVLSHFPAADATEAAEKTRQQLRQFKDVLTKLKREGAGTAVAHIANSAGLLYFPESHLDMIRPGISLYGYYPGGSPAGTDRDAAKIRLQPVMSFKTKVIQVKELAAGSGISYGHTYITSRRSRIAVLPVGYADGYLRKLSNRAEVLIHGRRAPVRGRICMNATMVDVTDLPPVHAGDEVVLLGRQGAAAITADEIAAWLETISYEILCLFGTFNARVFVNNGEAA